MKLNALFRASLLAFTLVGASAQAQTVEIKDAWIRATVQGQQGTGAFMQITAKNGAKLLGVSSPMAGVAEVHEMKMDGDVMKMRAVPGLPRHADGSQAAHAQRQHRALNPAFSGYQGC